MGWALAGARSYYQVAAMLDGGTAAVGIRGERYRRLAACGLMGVDHTASAGSCAFGHVLLIDRALDVRRAVCVLHLCL